MTSLRTDKYARFELTKPGVASIKPVVAGEVVPIVIDAVNAAKRAIDEVTSVRTSVAAAADAANAAKTAAEAARQYAADATTASGQKGTLVMNGATLPVPVYLNPTDPGALADGSIVLLDAGTVTPGGSTGGTAPAPTPAPTTGGTTPDGGVVLSASGMPFLSGAYTPTVADVPALEATRGVPLDVFYVKPDPASWTTLLSTSWTTRPHTGTRLAVQVPLWPANSTIDQAAAGTNAASWGQLAKMLRDGDTIVLGREFTLDTVHWAATDANATQWRTAWAKAYDAIKAANPAVQVMWAPSLGASHTIAQPRDVYVDGKVDVIGLTMWDWWPADTSDTAWQTIKTDPFGLDDWLAFAKAKGVKLGLAEWALTALTPGGRDNPKFIADVYRWLAANAANVWGEIYHSTSEGQRGAQLGTVGTTNATAQYTSSIKDVRAGGAVAIPSVVTVKSSSVTETSMTVSWTAATVGQGRTITGYQVTVDSGAPVNVSSTALSYTATGLTGGTTHTIKIAAVSSDWAMGPATAVTLTTTAPASTAPSGTTVYTTTFDSSDGWTAPTGSISGSQMVVSSGSVSYFNVSTAAQVAEKSVVRVTVTVLAGSTGQAGILVDCVGGGGGDWLYSTDQDVAPAALPTTPGTYSLDVTIPAGTEFILVGVDARGRTAHFLIGDLKVDVIKAGTSSDPAPAPTTPPPSTTPTTPPSTTALVAGGSPFHPDAYKALWGKTQFRAPGKGWPAHNPTDRFAAGRRVRVMADETGAGINADIFNIPVYLVDTSKPAGPVSSGGGNYRRFSPRQTVTAERPWTEDRWNNNYETMLRNCPFPLDFAPANGTDLSAEWVDIATGIHYGGWVWEMKNGDWQFYTAARTDNVWSSASGQFDKGSVVASGLLGGPMHIGIWEAQQFIANGRHIDHAIGVEFPKCDGDYDTFSWPAKTSDAWSPNTYGLLQASRLILDPTFNVAAANLTPFQKMICYIAQEWGLIITDTSGAVMVRGEQYRGSGTNPWKAICGPDQGDLGPIPWERMYVTAKDYRGPVAS
ncbi:fibronectin type III domain-containing protein [Arsenicicoccus dermatophilus]